MYISSPLVRFMHRGLRRVKQKKMIGRIAGYINDFLIKDVEITLRCGVTLKADLRQEGYRRMAGRGFHELNTEQFLSGYLRPGDIAVDVGAQIGMITAVAAKLVGRSGLVYSFEVDQANFAELLKTIRRNRFKNVRPQSVALGESAGINRFVRPKGEQRSFMYNPLSNSRTMYVDFDIKEAAFYESPTTTLDEFFHAHHLRRLDLIKIDVDGPELLILRGGVRTIAEYKPVLVIEFGTYSLESGFTFEEMWDFLKGLGYDIYAGPRLDDQIKHLKEQNALALDVSKTGLPETMLFCYLPDVHQSRWQNLWFMTP